MVQVSRQPPENLGGLRTCPTEICVRSRVKLLMVESWQGLPLALRLRGRLRSAASRGTRTGKIHSQHTNPQTVTPSTGTSVSRDLRIAAWSGTEEFSVNSHRHPQSERRNSATAELSFFSHTPKRSMKSEFPQRDSRTDGRRKELVNNIHQNFDLLHLPAPEISRSRRPCRRRHRLHRPRR